MEDSQIFKMEIESDYGIGVDELQEIQEKISKLIEEETGADIKKITFWE